MNETDNVTVLDFNPATPAPVILYRTTVTLLLPLEDARTVSEMSTEKAAAFAQAGLKEIRKVSRKPRNAPAPAVDVTPEPDLGTLAETPAEPRKRK
jgi:hypothetical protein